MWYSLLKVINGTSLTKILELLSITKRYRRFDNQWEGIKCKWKGIKCKKKGRFRCHSIKWSGFCLRKNGNSILWRPLSESIR